jgi:threonine/homoserine/homoserine lactone efflux protein
MDTSALWIYFVLVLGLVAIPGMDMAVVVANSLTGGAARGWAAVSGLVLGALCHAVASVLGIGVALKLFPTLFNAMLLLGALYVGWLGVSLWRQAREIGNASETTAARSNLGAFRQALTSNLLNPKAYLFMLAVFPQFIRPQGAPVWIQAAVLCVINAGTQAAVYGALAWFLGRPGERVESRPRLKFVITRTVAAALVGGAAATLYTGLRPM